MSETMLAAVLQGGKDLEASGAPSALKQAFELVRRGGTIVQIGVFSAPEISLPYISEQILFVDGVRMATF